MSAVAPATSRVLAAAATRRIAASSALPQKVLRTAWGPRNRNPVPFRYELSLRPCAARVSPIQYTICTGSDR